MPLHPGIDPSVCVFIKGLPDSYCRKVENPIVETFPDIDGPRTDDDEGPVMRPRKLKKKKPEPKPEKEIRHDSFVVKIPYELSGIWSVYYYINHSIPLNVYPIQENFYVVPMSEELSPDNNNIEVNSAVSMTYPPYGSIVQGSAHMRFKSHPITMQSAELLRIEVKEVMKMNLEAKADFLRAEQDVEPGSWFLSVQPIHR